MKGMIYELKPSAANFQTFLPPRHEGAKVHKVGSWLAWPQVVNREKHENREQNSRFWGPKSLAQQTSNLFLPPRH
jgi:hypothetical protein